MLKFFALETVLQDSSFVEKYYPERFFHVFLCYYIETEMNALQA